MRELWRRASTLFWERPILWLPVFVADIACFALTSLRHWLTFSIVSWLVQPHHSVLTNAPGPYIANSGTMLSATLLSGFFVWGSYFLRTLLYTMAYAFTANFVLDFIRPGRLDFRSSLRSLASKARPILGLTLRVFGCLVLASLLFAAFIAALLTQGETGRRLALNSVFTYSASFLVFASIAYFTVPQALALLREKSMPALNPEVLRASRSFAALGLLASTLIAFFVERAQHSPDLVYAHGVKLLTINVGGSLLAALPYIPLFIVLAVAAISDEGEVVPTTYPQSDGGEVQAVSASA